MASLSNDLQGIVKALLPSVGTISFSQYEQAITAKADALNEVGSCSETTSLAERAIAASKASKIIFGDLVVTPEDSSYKEYEEKNWSTTCWLPAACFIKILNTVELALVLKIVTWTQCKFAVRSGGHMASPGFNSVDGSGILLDLGALNEITLSSKRDIVSVGPGATWDMVYETLERYELTVVGGRAAGVGVGGLILGGGMSHFSNHWGMVCDNVKNFEVVLADSTIVQANDKDYPDLFRALKGGGPNFGIVTRYDLYTYPDFHVWFTLKIYNSSDAENVLKASMDVQKAMEEDDRIGFFLSLNVGFFVAGMLYRGECATAPVVFSAFDNITPMAVPFPETNLTQLSVAKAISILGKKKREPRVLTLRVDLDLHLEIYKILCEIATSTSFSLSCIIQPIGPAAVKIGQKHGGNSMNIPAEPQSWLAVFAEWVDDKDDELARSQLVQVFSSIESAAKSRGLLFDFKFMNDASHSENPLKSYGSESIAFLSEASRKWDPEGVFQRLQNSGFLLSNVDKL